VAFACKFELLHKYSSRESPPLRIIPQLRLRILRGARNQCLFSKGNKGNRKSFEGTSLLCVLDHRRQIRSGRESRACKYRAAEEVDVNNLPPFRNGYPEKLRVRAFANDPPSPRLVCHRKSRYVRGMSAIGFCPHSPSELDQLREAYGSLNDVERNLAGAIEPLN